MERPEPSAANAEARRAWNANAAFWDARMGEGNDFVEILLWPETERLLGTGPGARVLDAACGNGLYARKLAARGADVTAFDLSEEMIGRARARPTPAQGRIDYRVLDATNPEAIAGLGEGEFDAALCGMALFDMADIRPLVGALPLLLKPGAPFVFSVLHPCFNNPRAIPLAEMEDREGELLTTYGMKVLGYMTPTVSRSLAMPGQPEPHPLFHRPLGMLLEPLFEAGFVLDALVERAFPPDHPPGPNPMSWSGKFSEIPPVLIGRAVHSPRRSTHD
jgi:2-polyprenyl-3-methyl-5-hydroxy-6-metoxy-1,4-benzoquinol methylase